jgi:predicted Zn-dependent protease
MINADSEMTTSPDTEAYQAMKLLGVGKVQEAIERCHEAVARFGPNRNCYLVKARAHIELEEYGFAEKALQSVLSLDPEHPAAWAMLGEVYYRLGNQQKVDYCKNRLESIFPVLVEKMKSPKVKK